jgi:hypothetical protein
MAKKGANFPFHGKVQAIDTTTMTFTISGKTPRVFMVTADTKIKKNGQPATLSDAVIGDDAGGYTMKSPDGKFTALSVRFGPRPGGKKEKASPTPSAAPSASAH